MLGHDEDSPGGARLFEVRFWSARGHVEDFWCERAELVEQYEALVREYEMHHGLAGSPPGPEPTPIPETVAVAAAAEVAKAAKAAEAEANKSVPEFDDDCPMDRKAPDDGAGAPPPPPPPAAAAGSEGGVFSMRIIGHAPSGSADGEPPSGRWSFEVRLVLAEDEMEDFWCEREELLESHREALLDYEAEHGLGPAAAPAPSLGATVVVAA